MTLTPGTRIGAYQIVSALGAGGMGEVYRATDTTLKREVALKILPPALAGDPDRLMRFQREAEVLASLNHPNIAHIHGVEASSDVRALVMELVEGEDLSRRIQRGPIPLDEALQIARQIAEALEAAHEHGIIHRDLKPANIRVRRDGVIKVLDFGLAKAASAVAGVDSRESKTVTFEGTRDGMLLGTIAYMSPEQARGKPVDKRTDIWAFGCVVYEMLTGHRPFSGDTITDTLATILERDPDWTALAVSPLTIQRLLNRCLEKDPRRRLHDIGDARIEIEDAASGTATRTEAMARHPRSDRLPWAIAAIASLVALMVVGAWMSRVLTSPAAQTTPPRVSRTILTASSAAALDVGADRALAITPDGTRIVYVGEGSQIFVRPLDRLEPTPIFTAAVPLNCVFVSPDNEWIGFFEGLQLKKVAITGGPAVPITVGVPSAGATWAPDNTIIMADTQPGVGLMRVAAAGGAVTVLTRPAKDRGELDHVFPEMLPGGRAARHRDRRRHARIGRDARRQARDLFSGGSRRHVAGPRRYAPRGPAGPDAVQRAQRHRLSGWSVAGVRIR